MEAPELHYAVAKSDCDMARRVLDLHPSINVNSPNPVLFGSTPLHTAAQLGCPDLTLLFLDHPGVDVNCLNEFGETPLVAACSLGQAATVELLLMDPRVHVNQADNKNRTALWWAASKGYHTCAKLLVAHEARLDTQIHGSLKGETYRALDIAEFLNKTDLTSLITQYEADPRKARLDSRKALGLLDRYPARLFALVVLYNDQHFEIRAEDEMPPRDLVDKGPKKASNVGEPSQEGEDLQQWRRRDRARRFFRAMARVPMEQQMRICFLAYDSYQQFVLMRDFAPAFRLMLRLPSQPKSEDGAATLFMAEEGRGEDALRPNDEQASKAHDTTRASS